MNREIDLSVSAYGVTRVLDYALAVLPWGATEPHNLHLPYLTDAILAHDVAVDAAQKALDDYGVRAMVLPPVAMGAQNPGQRDLKFCIHYRQHTQAAILADIVASLHHQGLRRLLNAFALPSLQQKVAWLPRHWTRVTADTGIGNPHLATADKGGRFAEAVAAKYALLIKELAAVTTEQELYQM